MSQHKQPERRTFLQDRLEILIKKQQAGTATFNELTELDNIVNSDPEIRKKIIMESLLMDDTADFSEPDNRLEKEEIPALKTLPSNSLLNRIKSFFNRIFYSQISAIKIRLLINGSKQMVIL